MSLATKYWLIARVARFGLSEAKETHLVFFKIQFFISFHTEQYNFVLKISALFTRLT